MKSMNNNFKSKAIKTHETQDLFLKFSTRKVLTSLLRRPQRDGFLSTLTPLQATTKVNSVFHYESSHEDGNTNFPELNHKLGSL
jgi:hypothetical protein